jgi:hypothetical protein
MTTDSRFDTASKALGAVVLFGSALAFWTVFGSPFGPGRGVVGTALAVSLLVVGLLFAGSVAVDRSDFGEN